MIKEKLDVQKEKVLLNQSKFAEHIGKSKQYVSDLNKEGKLIKIGKLIDVAATMKNLKKISDPSKAKAQFIKEIPPEVKGALDDEEISEILENEDPNNYYQSRARKEYFLSKISENNYLVETKKLIEVELVDKQYFALTRQLRDKIFNIKNRVASQVSIMTDPIDIANLLDKEFRNVFNEIQAEAQAIINDLEKEEDEDKL